MRDASGRHIYHRQIRFADIDAHGHVNNARFLEYLEDARIALYLVGVAAWAVTGLSSLFAVAVAVTAFLATITVIQRIAHVTNALNEKKG